MKHPHHDLIVEWVKDTTRIVQRHFEDTDTWVDVNKVSLAWHTPYKYRFKPVSKPDVVKFYKITPHSMMFCGDSQTLVSNLRLTFDGETSLVKRAEVLK